ncbi:efflux RND transporter periplasmic adaptor subunit [Sphingomonas sp. KC8]|uniref:efflux RND transporter periplasmic adaptor subunit n=1 Tax=Sphingomonas sp. KC8 TaxID=1030157 RepID=UPI0009FC3DD7|nr:efflux RND transporter periplasmic adaptor subunit [Sphingomonas sp. KC8]
MTTTPSDIDEFLGVEPPSKYGRLLKWGAIGLGVLILLWIGFKLFGPSGADVNYATQAVRRGDLTVTVSATGNLQPTNQVDVGSELSGTVTEVNVDNNDRVAKGQVLARLDTSRLRDSINQSKAALASAQAGVMQAQATARQSRANLARLEEVYRLSGGKVPSATELDTARADNARAIAGVRTAEAQVAQARAQLSSDETQFSKASIVSPVNGVVLSRQIEPGQTVAASLNAPVLFQIAEDLSAMRLEVKVDEADVGQVQKGQRATFQVDAFPGRTFPATIERVDLGANATNTSSSSSSSSATSASSVVAYVARLTVANPDELLRPGMTATADIVTMEKNGVLLVPNAALRFSPDRAAGSGQRGGLTSVLAPSPPRRGNRATREVSIGRGSQQTVYIVGEDGKPKPIRVTVGDTNGSQTEVTGSEVKEGMEVITGQLAAGQTNEPRGDKAGGGERRQGGGDRPNGGAAGNSSAPAAAPTAGPRDAAVAPAKPAPAATASSAPATASTGDGDRRGDRAGLSDEERAARRAQWESMSPEERAQRRAERQAARQAAGGADGE